MPSGLLYLFNVYSSSQYSAALIASAFLHITQNFVTSHTLPAGLGTSTSSYLRHTGLGCLPHASNIFLKYLIIFGIHIYNSAPTFLSNELKCHLVLTGNIEVGTAATSQQGDKWRAPWVLHARTQGNGIGTGWFKKRMIECFEGGISSHTVISHFSLSGYLPFWGLRLHSLHASAVSYDAAGDMNQKLTWKSNLWEQLCHGAVRRKRYSKIFRQQGYRLYC